jgi:hypothetical protein
MLVQVTKQIFRQIVSQNPDLQSVPIEPENPHGSYQWAVMQYTDANNTLVAQAIYRTGSKPRYEVASNYLKGNDEIHIA